RGEQVAARRLEVGRHGALLRSRDGLVGSRIPEPALAIRPAPVLRCTLMEIKWTDTDPETGQRRFLCAERFARVWSLKWKLQRRGDWTKGLEHTRAMWDH